MSVPPTFRFAPSPNGYLHLGHAYSALLNQTLARRAGGRVLLRLEDIDPERCRPHFSAAIEDDLAWLGFQWQPPTRRQSDWVRAHAEVLDRLLERRLAYPCFCTRGEIRAAVASRPGWPRDPDGAPIYPGTCRGLGPDARASREAAGRGFGMRLDMAAALAAVPGRLNWTELGEAGPPETVLADAAAWGDVLVGRRDVRTSYHLGVVVDDARDGVTDVVRGRDLFAATGVHRLLQQLLGLPAPRYHHHRLISDAEGQKLSKSRHSLSLHDVRLAGRSASEIRSQLGFAP